MEQLVERFMRPKVDRRYREKPAADRLSEARRVLRRYTDRVPIVVEPDMDFRMAKVKFLVPHDLTVSQFVYVVRKHMCPLHHTQSVYVFTERNQLPILSQTIGVLYDREHNHDDLFLYLRVTAENTFGNV